MSKLINSKFETSFGGGGGDMLIIGVRNKSLSIYLTYDKINPHLSTGRNHVEKKKSSNSLKCQNIASR